MKRAILAIWIVPVIGCGSLTNLNTEGSTTVQVGNKKTLQSEEYAKPFGGVRWDTYLASNLVAEARNENDPKLRRGMYIVAGYMLAVDLPFSAALDTVTLPLTLWSSLNHLADVTPPRQMEKNYNMNINWGNNQPGNVVRINSPSTQPLEELSHNPPASSDSGATEKSGPRRTARILQPLE